MGRMRKVVARIIPNTIIRYLYYKSESTLIGMLLQEKTKYRIKKGYIKNGVSTKVININSSCNKYNMLNSCFINDMLGGIILCLGLGGFPILK